MLSVGVAIGIGFTINQPVTVAYTASGVTVPQPSERATEIELLTTPNNLATQLAQAAEEVSRLAEVLVARRFTDKNTTSEPSVAGATQPATTVPFYSQFADISDPSWQKVGCGVASLAMILDYYGSTPPVDELLETGVARGAYLNNAGWTHAGLIGLSEDYGLSGETISLAGNPMDSAFAALEDAVANGPVMVSVHYTFEPTNPIPHLAVVTGIKDGRVYYNDPAEATGGGSITADRFKRAWKKRYIEIRPAV